MTITNDIPPRLFLQADLDWLDERIEHVRTQIREAKLQGQEATEQSSESWHDNYNFEESQRQLKMLMNHLAGLSNARERSVVVVPEDVPTVVAVGATVTFRDTGNGRRDTFSIGSYMVSDSLRDLDFISYETPVAQALLGLSVGERGRASIGGEQREFEVSSITSGARLIASAMEPQVPTNHETDESGDGATT